MLFKKCCKNCNILLCSNNELLQKNKDLLKKIEDLEKEKEVLEEEKENHKGILLDLVFKIKLFLSKNYNEIYKFSVSHKSDKPEELPEE
jgi:hypothetical protein